MSKSKNEFNYAKWFIKIVHGSYYKLYLNSYIMNKFIPLKKIYSVGCYKNFISRHLQNSQIRSGLPLKWEFLEPSIPFVRVSRFLPLSLGPLFSYVKIKSSILLWVWYYQIIVTRFEVSLCSDTRSLSVTYSFHSSHFPTTPWACYGNP